MLSAFLEAVSQYGIPSRVRADCGEENVEVERFMLAHPEHGPHRSRQFHHEQKCTQTENRVTLERFV